MKWLFTGMTLTIGALLIAPGVASAQELNDSTDFPKSTINLFTWFDPDRDWSQGALYAALGLSGSLLTIFTLVGGAVPGSPGQARIDADTVRLEKLYERLERLIDDSPMKAPMVTAVEGTVNNLRDDLRKERWRQFFFAALFYAVGGALFATAIAGDMTQALVVGAGWTAFLGTIGVKSDAAFRQGAKDVAIDKLANKLGAVVSTQPNATEILGGEKFEHLMREAQIAKALSRR